MKINKIYIRPAAAGVLALILFLSGCGEQVKGKNIPLPEVAVVTIKPRQLVITTELAGRTSANRIAEVRPQVGGNVQKRLFTEGSDVQAGQVLFQIDPALYQAALDNAKATLARSEAQLSTLQLRADRMRELLADQAVSRQDYDDAAAALKQAQADIQYAKATVETARINLEYTSIKAPISGRIGKSNITEGALVTAHQPAALATILQLDPIYVDVPQSTAELLRLENRLRDGLLYRRNGIHSKVHLLMEDNTGYPWDGTLQFRDVTVDPTTGSVILRIIFPNPRGILLPGMFVRAVVEEGVNPEAILIPQQAVSRDPKGNPLALIVDKENKVRQLMPALDRAIGSEWLVSSGIAPGDRIIVEGVQKIRPGATVKVVPFTATGDKNNGNNISPTSVKAD